MSSPLMQFEFSDTIAGYVTWFEREKRMFGLKTVDGREFKVKLTSNVYARGPRNLGEPYCDYTAKINDMLVNGQYIFTIGIFYPERGTHNFEAKVIVFPEASLGVYRFEEPDWWIKQAKSIADFYIKAQFGSIDKIDYRNYRTLLSLTGERKPDFRQETDTISRMIYGLASAFLLTGEDYLLEAAEKGTDYLREHMRFYDMDENIVYWYHGIDVRGEKEHKIFASEFGDDYDAIPMYEQIYALAGPTQTYRINGDPLIMRDIKMTIDLFDRFFLDREKGGYFSHLDPVTLNPRAESLGRNRARKNWNSVGDHAPAYLINLWLATGDDKYKDFLTYTADCITRYFPDYEHSPFVQERFYEDWSHDKTWGWQQNRAVVGHNLKIAWNLMRINNLVSKKEYVDFAKKIAEIMPKVGMDKQRGGWYDVMERELEEGQEHYRFAWHDRKAWWQQEQAILAYQILYGVLKDSQYLKFARESSAFYNSFFLDHDDGAVYFNVLNNGIPFLLGTERLKGSHSMSCYHSIELCYLATVYINLLHTKQPLELYFKPLVNHSFKDNILRVEPDILPKGSVRISDVWIDGQPWKNFDSHSLTVVLPNINYRPKIRVRLVPVG
ncbi:MAG: AGE family epimerase/isomerase [Candidatus Omnitrophica bacterium]|nr:AGE family epimerase/isomerase [Candidatus Omnitrophota bacterium]MCM8826659.1 AGE family epimerase/isomerase [Candidatus Omnitrophota bacterium]